MTRCSDVPIGGSTGLSHAHSAAVDEAARWLAGTPSGARPPLLIPALRERFGLSALEAIEAERQAEQIREKIRISARPKRQPPPSDGAPSGGYENHEESLRGTFSQKRAQVATFNRAREVWLESIYSDNVLKTTTRLIALLLAEHFNREKFEATSELVGWPGQTRLGRMAAISDRAVRQHLSILEATGHLASKKGGNGQTSRDVAVTTDRNSASGLIEGADRKHSVSRPEAQRQQTGSVLPPTSDTIDTSEGGSPPGSPPVKVEREGHDLVTNPFELSGDARKKRAPRLRRFDQIDHPTHGRCLVDEIRKTVVVVRNVDTGASHEIDLEELNAAAA